jgi:hypothetical protein
MLNETLCPFEKPATYWPTKPLPARSALHRWRLTGVKGENGQRVKLETIKIGGRRYTSKEAVERFILAQNAMPAPKVPEKKRPNSSDLLEAMGI